MAYRFQSGHEESESGEKVLHGRVHQQPFLPYSQPSTSAGPLALPATEQEAQRSPSWFRGIISGAGKLISSVIGSEGSVSSPSECDSDYSSDEVNDARVNKHEDNLLSDGLAEFNKRKSAVDGNVEPLAIVSKNDSKLVIEQLLMQETFTRAEYGKLMTILRSRVLDIPSVEGGECAQNEVPKKFSDKRPWQLWNPNRNVFGTSDFSPSNPSVFTPRYYASEAVTSHPCSKAVPEAKKWFEQKKLSSSPICDQEYGPCSLNTDMNQYCFDGDDGSPIEMARSYMKSLPPWRSPSLGTNGFKSPPSSEKQSCSIGTHLLPSSKVRKRDYAATQTWDPKENSTVSLKSIDNEPRITKLAKTELDTTPLVLECFRGVVSTPFGYKFADENLILDDRKAFEVGHHREMPEEISRGIVMEPRVAFKEAVRVPKFAAVETPKYFCPDILSMYRYDVNKPIAMQNKGVDFTSVTKAQNGGIPAFQYSHALASAALGNGDSFTKTRTSLSEIVVPAEQSIQKSDSEVKVQADNAAEVNPNSDSKDARSFTDSKPPDENPDPNPKDAITPAEEININGHPTEINNSNSHIESMSNSRVDVPDGTPEPPANFSGSLLSTQIPDNNARHPTEINNSNSHIESMSNNCVDVPDRTPEPPANLSGSLPSTQIADNNASEPQDEKMKKSMERAESSGKRTAKKVVRQKRWKG